MKLKNFENFRKRSEVLQVETSPSSYGSFEEIVLEVCLHFFIFKNIGNILIGLVSHLRVQMLELKRNRECVWVDVEGEGRKVFETLKL